MRKIISTIIIVMLVFQGAVIGEAESSQNDFEFSTISDSGNVGSEPVTFSHFLKGSLDDDFVTFTEPASSEINKEIIYRIKAKTKSGNNIKRLSMLHILDEGVYLFDKIPEISGIKFYYTTFGISDNQEIEEFFNENHWKTSLENYEKANAIKIVVEDSQTFEDPSSVLIDMPLIVNELSLEKNVTEHKLYVSSTSFLKFYESSIIKNNILSYGVNGNVYEEETSDKLKSFENILVKLIDDNEEVVAVTQTNKDGYYWFDVYEQGKYSLQFTIPEGYEVSTPNFDDELGSHIFESGRSDTFRLNRSNAITRRNAAFIKANKKLLVSFDIKDYETDDKFEMQILINGIPYEGKAILEETDGALTQIKIRNGQISATQNETIRIEGLKNGDKYVISSKAPEGYFTQTPQIQGCVDAEFSKVKFIYNKKNELFTHVIWEGGGPKPNLEVGLFRNDHLIKKAKLTSVNGFEHKWTDLPLNGDYQLKILNAPKNYETHVVKVDEGFVVHGKYIPLKIDLPVSVEWDGGKERPDLEIGLYKDGLLVDRRKLTSRNGFRHSWNNLEMDGSYSIKVFNQPKEYKIDVETTKKSFLIRASYVSPKKDIPISVSWKGGIEHPEVLINLYRNGLLINSKLTNQHKVTFDNLDKFDKLGRAYKYHIDVSGVPYGFDTKINKYDIVNQFNAKTISFATAFIWDGSLLVESDVLIQLYRNGQPYGKPRVLEYGQQELRFYNLPLEKENNVLNHYELRVISGLERYDFITDRNMIRIVNKGEGNNSFLPSAGVGTSYKGGFLILGGLFLWMLDIKKKD